MNDVRPHLMEPEGAWSESGTAWYARAHYPKRSKAMMEFASMTGAAYVEVRCLARYAVHKPDHPEAPYYDGNFWVECDKDTPGAFPVWRCE